MTNVFGAPRSVDAFLRAGPESFHEWVTRRQSYLMVGCVAAIVIGAGSYGAVMGSWRDSWQALYTGIKLPLVILLTTAGNGLLNGMLAPLLGLNVTFRQSLAAVLVSFAITSIVLCALSPVALFIVWNTPPLTAGTKLSSPEYGFLQLTLAVFVALGGIIGNVRLLPLLRHWAPNAAVARDVLLAWLAGNLLLGSQICWVLRPFIWDSKRPVEFIGPEGFHGSFFETVFQAAWRLMS
ncbi:MAG TPA: hypothetical protein VH251_12290 [Verrucomicrobiae bacterium]|jgi:hypothetical protein|nr:hypothetical protein [Verrucomicrobiae bacterium]